MYCVCSIREQMTEHLVRGERERAHPYNLVINKFFNKLWSMGWLWPTGLFGPMSLFNGLAFWPSWAGLSQVGWTYFTDLNL